MKDKASQQAEEQHKKSRTQAQDRCFNDCTLEIEFPSNSSNCTK